MLLSQFSGSTTTTSFQIRDSVSQLTPTTSGGPQHLLLTSSLQLQTQLYQLYSLLYTLIFKNMNSFYLHPFYLCFFYSFFLLLLLNISDNTRLTLFTLEYLIFLFNIWSTWLDNYLFSFVQLLLSVLDCVQHILVLLLNNYTDQMTIYLIIKTFNVKRLIRCYTVYTEMTV